MLFLTDEARRPSTARWVRIALAVIDCRISSNEHLLECVKRNNNLNIDKNTISVSGISSGGFMAHQFHVAHSANIMGAGIVAGGPYYCADGSIAEAVTKCSKFMALQCDSLPTGLAAWVTGLCYNSYTGPRTDEESIALAQKSFSTAATWSNQGSINPISGLSRARVYLFTGLNDEIVPFEVMNAVYHFYADNDKANLTADNITLNRQFPAHHTMVTDLLLGLGKLNLCGRVQCRAYGGQRSVYRRLP